MLQFIDSGEFMANSLSDLVNDLFERIYKIKCKFGHDDEKCETCRIEYKSGDCFLQYANFKDNPIEYNCLCCYKNYQHKFHKKLMEQFFSTCKFSNHDNNKFILSLQKDVYPFEYMDDWEKFSETSLPKKEDFYSHLNMEDITDADYAHSKRVKILK